MTIEEVYAEIGGDYAAMLKRVGLPAMVSRFACMFLTDTSCQVFFEAWESGDDEAIFKAAHTVKGMCGNLGFTSMQELASEICEAYRPGQEQLRAETDTSALMDEFRAAHAKATEVISAFKAEQG